MGKTQRILTYCLWGLLLLAIVGVIAAKVVTSLVSVTDPPPVLYPTVPFVMTDQNGSTFSSESLKGKPYIASFMFTSCNGVCPTMNTEMSKLQKKLPPEFQFVSFTVDPATDTPAKLKSYAERFSADESRWHFLTGEKSKLEQAALDMKIPNKDWPAAHSDRMVLVDVDGNIRGYYHCNKEEEVSQLVKDAKVLSATPHAAGGRS